VFEFTRKRRRKRGKKLMIPAVEREVLLLSLGYKMHHILDAAERTIKSRRDRINSFHNKRWDRFHGAFESAKTALFKSLSPTGKTASGLEVGANDMLIISPRSA
jgi:hypothetical protein